MGVDVARVRHVHQPAAGVRDGHPPGSHFRLPSNGTTGTSIGPASAVLTHVKICQRCCQPAVDATFDLSTPLGSGDNAA